MHTVYFLIRLVQHHQVLFYSLIFFGLIIVGEFFLISTGILAHLGALNLPFTALVVLAGIVSKSVLGYFLGTTIKKYWNNVTFFKFMAKRVHRVLPKFKERPFWSIFLSKFIFGANNLIIIYSGFQRVNFKRYLRAEAMSNCLWAPAMIALGYLFSYAALHFSHEAWSFLFVLLILFILFAIFDKFVSWLYELFEEIYNDVQ